MTYPGLRDHFEEVCSHCSGYAPTCGCCQQCGNEGEIEGGYCDCPAGERLTEELPL